MVKNEIQNYLNEKFPELKLIVQYSPNHHRGYTVGFRTDIRIEFSEIFDFDKISKHRLLCSIEDILYKKLGLLNKALDDVRKIRRKLT
jgi:hypothetical protein